MSPARNTPGDDGAFEIPPMFIALSATAMIFLAGGAIGLVSPDTVSALAKPAVAWSLIVVGAMLDVGAALQLLAARRAALRRR